MSCEVNDPPSTAYETRLVETGLKCAVKGRLQCLQQRIRLTHARSACFLLAFCMVRLIVECQNYIYMYVLRTSVHVCFTGVSHVCLHWLWTRWSINRGYLMHVIFFAVRSRDKPKSCLVQCTASNSIRAMPCLVHVQYTLKNAFFVQCCTVLYEYGTGRSQTRVRNETSADLLKAKLPDIPKSQPHTMGPSSCLQRMDDPCHARSGNCHFGTDKGQLSAMTRHRHRRHAVIWPMSDRQRRIWSHGNQIWSADRNDRALLFQVMLLGPLQDACETSSRLGEPSWPNTRQLPKRE